jgi:hypothetical protein
LSVGLDKTLARYCDETLAFAALGGAELRFLYAPYGRGKTHFLRVLQQVAAQQNFLTAYIDCRIEHTPFLDLQSTYRRLAGEICLPTPKGPNESKKGIDAVIARTLTLTSSSEAAFIAQMGNIQSDRTLAVDFRNLVSNFGRSLLRGDEDDALRRDLRGLLRSDPSLRIRVSDLYKSQPWLDKPMGKVVKRNAWRWLQSLMGLSRSLDYAGLVVLYDETEMVYSSNRLTLAKRQQHLANLRNFIDLIATGAYPACVVYYSVVEDFLEQARGELAAFSQRIERIRIGTGGSGTNPRAVWVDLDELTSPGADDPAFFMQLGERILQLGTVPGSHSDWAVPLRRTIQAHAERQAASIASGGVREFVKTIATLVATEASRNARN